MSSHTPGPWEVDPIEYCGPDGDWGVLHLESGGRICYVGDPYPRGDNNPYENMVLIAAAPDLLDVLERAYRVLSGLPDANTSFPELLSAMTAVLAEAKGEAVDA